MFKLVISDDEGKTTVVPLVRDEISIGRKEGNTIRLTERNVSRQHAELQRGESGYVVKDRGSYNGTLVNGTKIKADTPLQPGDKVAIGDYLLSLEREKSDVLRSPDTQGEIRGTATQEKPPSSPAPPPHASLPARVVMLGAPSPGAEFPVPPTGATLGRSEALTVPISHRSVSRDHARIDVQAGRYRIVDLGSANGLRVNGTATEHAPLASGDMFELGDVRFRFVGAGEPYVFEPTPSSRDATGHGRRWTVMGLGLALLIGAALLASIDRSEDPAAAAIPTAPASAGPVKAHDESETDGSEAEVQGVQPSDDDGAQRVEQCRAALEGGRYAEALAHASRVLDGDADETEARACQAAAAVGHEDEQTYVLVQTALDQGDVEAAYFQATRLSPESTFRDREEVTTLAERVVEQRISRAQSQLQSAPDEAAQIARSIRDVAGVSTELQEQAQKLERAAQQRAQQVAESKTETEAPRRSTASKRQASSDRSKSTRSRQSSPSSARRTDPPRTSPFEEATACLARGDNACVVRALHGHARTAQELALLIETYRAMGLMDKALAQMMLYVQRFPAGPRADAYRQLLERHNR